MNSELTIYIGDKKSKIYMQNGFFECNTIVSGLHNHFLAEIHAVLDGALEYRTEQKTVCLKAGEVMLIPPGVYHCCINASSEAKHSIFQIESSEIYSDTQMRKIPISILQEFSKEIAVYRENGYDTKLKSYLSLICTEFLQKDMPNGIQPIKTREFIINEFFSKQYSKDVTINDLASELNLSKKQTERMILKFTGNNFRQEISKRRIIAAKLLINSENYNLNQICEMVGYRSYSGFWKAIKKSMNNP